MKEFRRIYSDWRGVKVAHGINPSRVPPTKFVSRKDCPGWEKYWRDVPSRASMQERVSAYFKPQDLCWDENILLKAFDTVARMFRRHFGEMSPLSVDQSVSRLPSDTSAGPPFKSGVRKGEARNGIKRLVKTQWRRAKSGLPLMVLPCRAGVRRQLRLKGENKPRLIWAFPGYINVLENQFSGPFVAAAKPPFLGWSINWLDEGRSLLRVKDHHWKCHSIAQIDFSGFDSSVPTRLIRLAFCVIRHCLKLDSTQNLMLNQLEDYFIHTPLIFYNKIVVKHRGIPSGSSFTQLIGSICNMIACYYSSLKGKRYGILPQYSCWLGDDSLVSLDEGMAKEEFDDLFLAHFSDLGLTVSSEKTNYVVNTPLLYLRDPIKFLGREIQYGRYEYKMDREKLSAQVMWPEKPDRTRYDTAARLIGLVWAYGMYKPYYVWYHKLYSKLHIRDQDKIVIRREVTRFVYHIVGSQVDLSRFPQFETVQSRYFGPIDRHEKITFRPLVGVRRSSREDGLTF